MFLVGERISHSSTHESCVLFPANSIGIVSTDKVLQLELLQHNNHLAFPIGHVQV